MDIWVHPFPYTSIITVAVYILIKVSVIEVLVVATEVLKEEV